MVWEEVKGDAIDIKKREGEAFEGVYLETKEIQTTLGKQFIYNLEDIETGKIFGIYGFTTLNNAMGNVSKGSHLRITYTGMENMVTKRWPSGKDIHTCKVEMYIPADDDIPVRNTEEEPF